jgi:imidazolonepropionase
VLTARAGSCEVSPAGTLEIETRDGLIVAVAAGLEREGRSVVDCDGRLLTPAFVDCHTHIVHGGNRSLEFEARLAGADYEEIARRSGGIASTMRATRGLDVEGLVAETLPRLDCLLAEGVSTIEVKSGYGLEIEAELNMLRAARHLAELRPVRIKTTWLAAHALPPEFKDDRQGYLRDVAMQGLRRAHAENLVDAVDAFCEGIAFSVDEIEPLFGLARDLGLPVKLHAEQLSHCGGAALAARYRALSADHLEYATAADAGLMKDAGSVAVLLPGAFYTLRETQKPPIEAFRAAGVPMALATDCNPGTSPLTSLLLTMNMGATLFRMTVAECILGVTAHAARALGLDRITGTIAPGLSADFTLWDVETPALLVNRIGLNPLHARIFRGEMV